MRTETVGDAPLPSPSTAMRLPADVKLSGEEFLAEEVQWFYSVNLAESHPDDRLALLGLLAAIIRHQDKRLDKAVEWYQKHAAAR